MKRFSPLLRYGVATLAVALVLLLKLLLDPLIPEQSPFLMLAGAVMVGAWFGGLGPGLLATALGALVADYFFLAPRGSVRAPGGRCWGGPGSVAWVRGCWPRPSVPWSPTISSWRRVARSRGQERGSCR